MKWKKRITGVCLLGAISCGAAVPALAQTRTRTVTIDFAMWSPIVALIAGILILIFPRLLNYIVAIYLILVGLIGIFGPAHRF
jgi:hypothetical protein